MRQGIEIGLPPRAALRLHLQEERRVVALAERYRLTGEFGVDPAQRQAAQRNVAGEAAAVGAGDGRVHAHQHLAGGNGVAIPDENFAHHAALGGLDDLGVGGGHQPAFGDGHDVELARRATTPAQSRTKRRRPTARCAAPGPAAGAR